MEIHVSRETRLERAYNRTERALAGRPVKWDSSLVSPKRMRARRDGPRGHPRLSRVRQLDDLHKCQLEVEPSPMTSASSCLRRLASSSSVISSSSWVFSVDSPGLQSKTSTFASGGVTNVDAGIKQRLCPLSCGGCGDGRWIPGHR